MPDIVNSAKHPVAPSGYTGPLDVVSGADALYTLRAASAAQASAGTKTLINIKNGTTSETCDVLVASNGGFGNVANCSGASSGVSVATFCLAATCTVQTWYDISGANYCSGSPCNLNLSASAPTLHLTGDFGSLPYVSFAGQTYLPITFTSISPPWTISGVAERTGNFTTIQYINTANTPALVFASSANTIAGACDGNVDSTVTAADSASHSASVVGTVTDCILNVDGTINDTSKTIAAYSGLYPPYALTGDITEVGVWPLGFTSGQQTSMCHNQYSYWGTSVSC